MGMDSVATDPAVAVLAVRGSECEPGVNQRDALLRTLHNAHVRRHAGDALSPLGARALDTLRYARDPDGATSFPPRRSPRNLP